MTWNVGDHGFEMTLSTRVPDLIGADLRPWLGGWLGGTASTIEDVASWAIHPGGPRILTAVEEALGLSEQDTAVSREVLDRVWQYVVADGPVHPGSIAAAGRSAAVRGSRLRPRSRGGSGAVRVGFRVALIPRET